MDGVLEKLQARLKELEAFQRGLMDQYQAAAGAIGEVRRTIGMITVETASVIPEEPVDGEGAEEPAVTPEPDPAVMAA